MARGAELRELLYANVALLQGKAQASDVAAAIYRYWDRRATDGVTLLGELLQQVELDEAAQQELVAEVDQLATAVEAAQRALAGELGPAPAGAGADAATPVLREVPADRYVDFMPVGEGGMGIVYWAVDSDLKRQVAFKVVRPPGDTPGPDVTPPLPFALRTPGEDSQVGEAFDEMAARFLQEAWVTGGMEHPGVVPIYDVGRTQSGVPYYTMKFVRGSRTLATAVEEVEGKGVEERMELLEPFLKVCDTIRYAHSRGVLHRDLKPENVALGEFGEAVVLDWGLARLVEIEDALQSRWRGDIEAFRESADLRTMTSAVGTPGYMAPEAAIGLVEELDERGDVYGLGVILYEILTGRRPFEFRTFREYQEQVVHLDVPDAREVSAEVPQALADVCRGALARKPSERTRSVDDLAAGVRAWQAQRAVDREIDGLLLEADAELAAASTLVGASMLQQVDRATVACRRALALRPEDEGARQRLQQADALRERGIVERERLARRRVLRVVAGGALAAAAVVAVVVAWLVDARRQRAEDTRQRAERVMSFMVHDMHEGLEPVGRLDLLTKLGTEACDYFDSIPEEGRSPRSLRNGAVAQRNLASVYRLRGKLDKAKKAYAKAVTIAEDLSTVAPDHPEAARLASQARAGIGLVLIEQGYPHRALDLMTGHMEEMTAQQAGEPDSREHRAALADAHWMLGRAQSSGLSAPQALASFTTARSLGQVLVAEDEADSGAQRKLVRYLLAEGDARGRAGDAARAASLVERAAARVAAGRKREPQDVRWKVLELGALQVAANLTFYRGELVAAVAQFEAALASVTELRRSDDENVSYEAKAAHVLSGLGRVGHLLAISRWEEEKARRVEAGLEEPPLPTGSRVHLLVARGIYKRLVVKDESNAAWAHGMVEICGALAEMTGGSDTGIAASTQYRDTALEFARKRRDMGEENILWQHLYAYTLNKAAGAHVQETPEKSLRDWAEVMDVCQRVAEAVPASRHEVGILQAEAAADFAAWAGSRGDREGQLAALRRSWAFLQVSLELQPADGGALNALVEQAGRLALALAAGEADEVAEARRVLAEALERIAGFRAAVQGDPAAEAAVRTWTDLLETTRTKISEER